ncbi:hypothetical protein TIFTF001_046997 [Ficus carica]|uniref:Uncharacterized protein n=1 Tax=Ficus carica TaxID=3494 RepID=A0AA87Z861_FICCA|nr:hypothetical protein TIFTF001_046997 [Ficus carica]
MTGREWCSWRLGRGRLLARRNRWASLAGWRQCWS